MAKVKTSFVCTACGTVHPRWVGQCTGCGEWNTVTEETEGFATAPSGKSQKAQAANTVSLTSEAKPHRRTTTGMSELDRVLGGGLVEGSALLIGGDPGIGKSTILLQTAGNLAQSQKSVLYVSGEESAYQIQMRAGRLGLSDAPIDLCTAVTLEVTLATIKKNRPDVVIIDSIQTIYAEAVDSAPGTVSQVRLAAHELINAAKTMGCIIIFVGHVTKDGTIAGPRVLEHMVDAVLYFEGDRGNSFRLLRTFKNRFGSTGEIGVFEMKEQGLIEVPNPSALFLSERPENASGSAVMAAMNGSRPVLVEVQALVSQSNLAQPRRTTLGVDAGRVAMIAAVLDKHAGYTFANHDIFLNITGGLKITEPAADLTIAAALVSSLMNKPLDNDTLIFGELGLSGEVRGVNHSEQRTKEAQKLGFNTLILPPHKNETKTTARLINLKHVNDLSGAILG